MFGLSEGPPIPVEEIAGSQLLLHVEQADDLLSLPGAPVTKGHLSGILFSDTRTIWVDRSEAARSPGRRRFTIAHEVGHWVLHVDSETVGSETMRSSFCRSEDLTTEPNLGNPEAEANLFAATLLMPFDLLRAEADRVRFNIPLLAKRFDVSVPAMRLRLMSLDLLPGWMRG